LEDIGYLESGQCQPVPLGDELAGLACHKFLGCGSWMRTVEDEKGEKQTSRGILFPAIF